MTDEKYEALAADAIGDERPVLREEEAIKVPMTKEGDALASNLDPVGSSTLHRFVVGVLFGIGVCFTSVLATQFAQSTYSDTFNGPFFTIWFSTSWMMLCYPAYIVGSYLLFPARRKAGIRMLFREDQALYGNKGLTIFTAIKVNGVFLLLWVGTNYVFVRALGLASATIVVIIFSTNTAIVYLLSWLLLVESVALIPAKTLSVLLSIAGTIMVLYNGFKDGENLDGTFVLPMIAAFGAAFYKVIFKRVVGNASYGQVSLFLSLIGLLNFLLMWPVLLTLYFVGQETWDVMPWWFLCGNASLAAVFNFLTNFGIAVTFPLLISLGHIMGIPMNAVVDVLFRGDTFDGLQIAGATLVIAGFLVMVLPASIQERLACCCLKPRPSVKAPEGEDRDDDGKEMEPMRKDCV